MISRRKIQEIDEYLADLNRRIDNGELGTPEERRKAFRQAYTTKQRREMFLRWMRELNELFRVGGRWPEGEDIMAGYKAELARLDQLH